MDGEVVVGIDGSPEGDAALSFAIEEATLRKLPLRIVCAWEASAAEYVGEAFAATADGLRQAEDHARDVVRIALERVAPDADLRAVAVAIEGHPATVLVEQARQATLLVVGSRGRGAAASLVLGSVSTSIVHHASCPIVVVPSPQRREEL